MDLSRTHRRIAAGIALAFVMFGAWLSTGEARLTAVNDGFDITYPWPRGFGALLCAAGLVLLAAALRRSWLWILSGLFAVVSAGVAVHLLSYRLDTTDEAIVSRVMLRRTAIAWRDVQHVGSDPTLVVVSGSGERKIAIDTTDYSPHDRLTLSRTITRRVNEASAARAATVATPAPARP